jgi:hypothetical protein
MVNLGTFLLGGKSAAHAAGSSTAVVTHPPAGRDSSPPRVRSPSPERAHGDAGCANNSRSVSRLTGGPTPVYGERTEEHGPYNAKQLAAVLPKHHVLDFSFLDLEDSRAMMRLEPRAGKLHGAAKGQPASPSAKDAPRGPGKEAERREGATADGTAWDFGGYKAGGTEKTRDGYLVVRAGDETYAFKDEDELERQRAVMKNDPDNLRYELDAKGKLVERKQTLEALAALTGHPRYHCSALKVDHNKLTSRSVIVLPQVLAVLTVGALTNLQSIDLSFNLLETVPNFSGLPLHTLLLHCNRIPTLAEAAKLQAMNKTLRKLSLNDNPLQEATKRYKYAVLHMLPFLTMLDEVRVTDKDRERMAVFEELFVPAKQRGTTKHLLAAA